MPVLNVTLKMSFNLTPLFSAFCQSSFVC